MKILLLLVSSILAFGQAARSSVTPRGAVQTINYYISTAGSNSNPCTSASKCLTLAHVLTLIPQTLDQLYVINVADGTYAEAIDVTGFFGTGGFFTTTYNPSLTILGNTTTPGNVVFTGSSVCNGFTGTTDLVGVCLSSTATVVLNGITIAPSNSSTVFGVACWGGNLRANKLVITMTTASHSIGFEGSACHFIKTGDITITGFDTDRPPDYGLGMHFGNDSVAIDLGGTLTITGASVAADLDGTAGFIVEYHSSWTHINNGVAANVTISNVNTGVVVGDNAVITDYYNTGTWSLTNASTPTGSTGFDLHGGGAVNLGLYQAGSGATIVFNHWTKCIFAGELSEFENGGTRTFTNCGANTTTSGGAQILLF